MEPVIWHRCASDALPDDLDWLTPSERAQLPSSKVPKRRQDWLLGRYTCKQALSAQGLSADAVSILPAKDGAPELRIQNSPVTTSLSLSHRSGYAACVLGDLPGLGCDLEQLEPRTERFVQDYFRPSEQALIARSSHPEQTIALLWSAKESALKALRVGLRRDTRSLSIEPLDSASGSWSALSVKDHSMERRYFGWWRSLESAMLMTVVSTSPCLAPKPACTIEQER